MQSEIEHAKKYISRSIKDWINIFRIARSKRNRDKHTAPYNVRKLEFNKFLTNELKNFGTRNYDNPCFVSK